MKLRSIINIVFLLSLAFAAGCSCAVADTNTVDAAAPTVAAPAFNWSILIPVIAPLLVAGFKYFEENIPSWFLPILAVILGAILDAVMQQAGLHTEGTLAGAALGGTGVALREIIDQIKKRLASSADDPDV